MNEEINAEKCLLDKRQLAARLQVVPRTIDNLMAAGRIPYIKLGNKLVRFDWEAVKSRLEGK